MGYNCLFNNCATVDIHGYASQQCFAARPAVVVCISSAPNYSAVPACGADRKGTPGKRRTGKRRTNSQGIARGRENAGLEIDGQGFGDLRLPAIF